MKITKSKRFWAMSIVGVFLMTVTILAIFKDMQTIANVALGGLIAEIIGYFAAETKKPSKNH